MNVLREDVHSRHQTRRQTLFSSRKKESLSRGEDQGKPVPFAHSLTHCARRAAQVENGRRKWAKRGAKWSMRGEREREGQDAQARSSKTRATTRRTRAATPPAAARGRAAAERARGRRQRARSGEARGATAQSRRRSRPAGTMRRVHEMAWRLGSRRTTSLAGSTRSAAAVTTTATAQMRAAQRCRGFGLAATPGPRFAVQSGSSCTTTATRMLSTESTAGKEPQEGLGEDLYGLASVQGPRPSHEDAHLVVESGALGMDAVSAFGVFDGFGGSEISTMLSKTVLDEVQEAMKEYKVNTEDPSGRHNAELIALSMRDGFLKLDEKMVELEAESGSTLVMMLMTPTHLVIANVGDSRFMLSSKNGTSMFTTKDHKPTDEKEFARIVNTAGGFVEYGRVNGRLAVARAFGASYFKKDPSRGPLEQAVTPEPDLFIFERSDLHDFAILGSDGLWDVFSPHQIIGNVVPFIKPEPTRAAPDAKDDSEAFWAWFAANPTAARPSNLRNLNDVSMQLCVDSLNRGSTDNVTALIIKF